MSSNLRDLVKPRTFEPAARFDLFQEGEWVKLLAVAPFVVAHTRFRAGGVYRVTMGSETQKRGCVEDVGKHTVWLHDGRTHCPFDSRQLCHAEPPKEVRPFAKPRISQRKGRAQPFALAPGPESISDPLPNETEFSHAVSL